MPQALRHLDRAGAAALFRRIGITFAVCGEGGPPGPADPVRHGPARACGTRMGAAGQGDPAAGAGAERVHRQCLRAGRDHPRGPHSGAAGLPENAADQKALAGFVPSKVVCSHIVGIDIVWTGPEAFFVPEDNSRT